MESVTNWLFPPQLFDFRKSWPSWVLACTIWAFVIGAWFAIPMVWRAAVCSVAVCG